MDKPKLQSKLEQEIEESFRATFEDTPLLMLEDQAQLLRDVVVRVCDEYIAKGREYRLQWAMNLVSGMMNAIKEDESE